MPFVLLVRNALRRALKKTAVTPRIWLVPNPEVRVLWQAVVVYVMSKLASRIQVGGVAHADESAKKCSIHPIRDLSRVVVRMLREYILYYSMPVATNETARLLGLQRRKRRICF